MTASAVFSDRTTACNVFKLLAVSKRANNRNQWPAVPWLTAAHAPPIVAGRLTWRVARTASKLYYLRNDANIVPLRGILSGINQISIPGWRFGVSVPAIPYQ